MPTPTANRAIRWLIALMVLCCDPLVIIDGRSFSVRDLTTTPTPVHKRRSWGAGRQRRKVKTVQIVTRHRAIRAVSGLQHFRTICADGHFSAHGMPNGTRVVSSACGQRVERPARDPQVPLPDALGGPGSRLSPVSLLKSLSTRPGTAVAKHGFLRHSTTKCTLATT